MTAHADALAQDFASGRLYLEIEGIPYAFGNFAAGSSWFPGGEFEGVRSLLRIVDTGDLPSISAQRIDFLRSRTSIGSVKLAIVDTGEAVDDAGNTLAGYVAPWRADRMLRLAKSKDASVDGSGSTTSTVFVNDERLFTVGGVIQIGSDRAVVIGKAGGTDPEIRVAPALSTAPSGSTAITVYDVPASSQGDTATVEADGRAGGSLDDWPASGLCWIGAEACGFTRSGGVLTLTRGKHRSMPATHLGPFASAGPVPGSLRADAARVTLYPDGLVGRRCWLRWGLDAESDADAVDLFVGSIASAQWDNGAGALVVELEDAQSWLRRPLFVDTLARIPPGSTCFVYSLPGGEFVVSPEGRLPGVPTNASIAFVVGDRLIVGRYSGTGFVSDAFQVQLGEPFARPEDAGPRAGNITLFAGASIAPAVVTDAAADVLGGIPYDHPLEVLLALLTSTGTGENGNYDVLPADMGLGVPEGAVDVAGIVELVGQTPQLRGMQAVILEPLDDAREWMIETLLQPFGFCLRPTFDKPIAVKRILAPTPDEVAAAAVLTLADLAVDGPAPALLDGPTMENAAVVGRFEVESGPYLRDGKIEWDRLDRFGIVSSDVRRGYQSAQHVKARVWHPWPGEVRGYLARMQANLWARFEVPPVILRVAVSPGPFLTLAAGDLVAVTLPHLPSVSSQARGYDSVVCEVWGRSVDLPTGRVILELAQTSVTLRAVRLLSPALAVTGWNDGTKTLTVEANAYSATGRADTDPLEAGMPVRIVAPEFDATASAVVVSKTGTTLVIDKDEAALGLTPADGWHVTLGSFAEVTSPVLRGRYAWRADEDARLSGGTRPHVYA